MAQSPMKYKKSQLQKQRPEGLWLASHITRIRVPLAS